MHMTRLWTVTIVLTASACDGEATLTRSREDGGLDSGMPPAADGGTHGADLDSGASFADAMLDSGETYLSDAGILCCTPSPTPACCMRFGGTRFQNGGCAFACDGMPWPGDPAWQLVSDKNGCATWSSRGATGGCCGQAIQDGGALPMCYPDLVDVPF
jgi:hypothetical protein